MAKDITTRRAQERDIMLYFHWANDEVVRRHSIQKKPIALDEHRRWFLKKIADPSAFLYVIETDHTPIGQIRFEVEGEVATLSYSLHRAFRGKGLGATIVTLGIEALRHDKPPGLRTIRGWVQVTNPASVRVFEKLHFTLVDEEVINGESYLIYERSIS